MKKARSIRIVLFALSLFLFFSALSASWTSPLAQNSVPEGAISVSYRTVTIASWPPWSFAAPHSESALNVNALMRVVICLLAGQLLLAACAVRRVLMEFPRVSYHSVQFYISHPHHAPPVQA